jgi:integrase/recombinase XerD
LRQCKIYRSHARSDVRKTVCLYTESRQRLKHSSVTSILQTIAKQASVHKAVNPHNFRHSRATHLAKHLTEAQMNEFMGWAQGSNMPSTYVHLSGRDANEALLKLSNIRTDEDDDQPEDFSIKPCVRCGIENSPASRFCDRCGFALDEKAASDVIQQSMEHNRADNLMDRLFQDSEFRSMVEQKLGQLSASGVSPSD